MITYMTGNIFDSPAQVLANPVNTKGVMGKGLALEFKRRFPEMFDAYKLACREGIIKPGGYYLYHMSERDVMLVATKDDWRKPSKLEYIDKALRDFAANFERLDITSIAFPKLGCGCGGLDWDDVRPVMARYLDPLPISVHIYI